MRGFYEQCMLPEPYQILGRDLKPFAFGHFIILRRFGVGFVCYETVPFTLEDLTFSIFVCSHTWEENHKLLYERQFVPLSQEWGRTYWKENGEPDMAAVAFQWIKYLNAHTIRQEFKVINPKKSALEQETEWYEDVLAIVAKDKGYTESQLMNLPMCRLIYESQCCRKRDGIITLGRDEESFKERKEAYLKKLKEQNA